MILQIILPIQQNSNEIVIISESHAKNENQDIFNSSPQLQIIILNGHKMFSTLAAEPLEAF